MSEYSCDYDDLPIKEKPKALSTWQTCPVCKGRGRCYTTPEHDFTQPCKNCFGIGYVKNPNCIHEWQELSPEEARKKGLPHRGPGFHDAYICPKCKSVMTQGYLQYAETI